MFTGIILATGCIQRLQPADGDVRLVVDVSALLPLAEINIGDSVAVNGVCLTARNRPAADIPLMEVDVSRETLDKTTLGQWRQGQKVNLEPALRVGDRLGGHLVSGHVDGLAEVVNRHEDARSLRVSLRAPRQLARFIAPKGSVCLDGVSLTVNRVDNTVFDVNLVPHTAAVTTLGHWRVGDAVNLEVDTLARYVARLQEYNSLDEQTESSS